VRHRMKSGNLIKVLEQEIDARERAFSLSNQISKGPSGRNPPTATSLLFSMENAMH